MLSKTFNSRNNEKNKIGFFFHLEVNELALIHCNIVTLNKNTIQKFCIQFLQIIYWINYELSHLKTFHRFKNF